MRTKVAVALVIAAFLFGAGIAAMLGYWLARREATPQVAQTPTVIQQIQALSELVTIKYVMQKIVTFTNASTTTMGQLPNVMKFPGFEEDRITLMAYGIVKAGVDLSQLKPEQVRTTPGSITVHLPRATVTDAYLDEAQTQVLDRKTGVFRSFESTLEQRARQYARLEMTRAARQSGIEREADQRAKEQLTKLLESLGFKEIVLE